MEDKTPQGQEKEPVETAEQVEDMPASEQEPVGAEEEGTEKSEEGLPEDTSERTREQFEKLLERNREMSEKLAKTEKREAKNALEDVFSGLSPQPAPVAPGVASQPQSVVDEYIDEQGNVDVRGLNAALQRANYTAQQAAQMAQQAVIQAQKEAEQVQVREAHSKHPWLDPSADEFDEESYELVKDRLMRNWAEGKQIRLVDIANQIAKKYRHKEAEIEEEPAVSKSKARASTTRAGKGRKRESARVDVDELRQKARRGDLSAVDQLIELATK